MNLDEITTYAVVRYGTPEDYYIDIMSRIGEVFSYDDLEYELINDDGLHVRIATIETLIKLKGNTARPKDKLDVSLLKQIVEEKQ